MKNKDKDEDEYKKQNIIEYFVDNEIILSSKIIAGIGGLIILICLCCMAYIKLKNPYSKDSLPLIIRGSIPFGFFLFFISLFLYIANLFKS